MDKTDFIKEWWENADAVTLITRPRRFGKTLNLDMMNCFFSRTYQPGGDADVLHIQGQQQGLPLKALKCKIHIPRKPPLPVAVQAAVGNLLLNPPDQGENTREELDQVVECLKESAARLRSMSPEYVPGSLRSLWPFRRQWGISS